ncbi:hypothetical protein ZYGR_0AS04990 [Zygosaccharomyces rouxii]|uniref:Uncharacterized protein n=1 Tax=Zygosaccharomyces rouxii TaxID=4956 RepID=A0A1Q3AHN5_ZYGRO|nr:hypothetical protein ZYGR_0AS04990 [Zygosaccharomyces rouxii]
MDLLLLLEYVKPNMLLKSITLSSPVSISSLNATVASVKLPIEIKMSLSLSKMGYLLCISDLFSNYIVTIWYTCNSFDQYDEQPNLLRKVQNIGHVDMSMVPKETIVRILKLQAFEHESTIITEETVTMLQKYLEVFVREAVQRSVANKDSHGEGNGEVQLNHEDLEKITGMLLLDM